MRFSAALTTLFVAAAASAAEISVIVGVNSTLAFSPTNVTASAGDVLVFAFEPKNHTVTQSTFSNPCTKANSSAIDSGFQPVSSASASSPTFRVTVNDTKPLWFYCAQTLPANHCRAGMVFAVNPPANETFVQFQGNAKNGGSSNSTTGNSTSTSSSAAPTKSNGAVSLGNSIAGPLALVGLVAGLAQVL
ncbi:hypothetical protein AX15_006298 [Amanita polypyramis BW_CC]|nr:hypothetical protein AX15_006298 [Amanita polypyramis BW_CC]